jgi:antitoxin HigA-1
MLLEEFVKPLNITQTELAQKLGVSYPHLNEIIKGRRSVTPDTALRLSQVVLHIFMRIRGANYIIK